MPRQTLRLLLLQLLAATCTSQVNFMSFLDPEKMGRMIQLAQDITRATAGGMVETEKESIQRASMVQPVSANAAPSEMFAQGLQNLMLPARAGLLNAIGPSLEPQSTISPMLTAATQSPLYNPFTSTRPAPRRKAKARPRPKPRPAAKKWSPQPKRKPIKPAPASYEDSDGSMDYSDEYSDEDEPTQPPRRRPPPRKRSPQLLVRPKPTTTTTSTTTTTTTTTSPLASVDPEPTFIEQNPFIKLAQSFLRGATGSATDSNDGVELRPTFKSPPTPPPAQPQMSGLQAMARAFMGAPQAPAPAVSSPAAVDLSGIPRSEASTGSQAQLGVLDFGNMARLAQSFLGSASESSPSLPPPPPAQTPHFQAAGVPNYSADRLANTGGFGPVPHSPAAQSNASPGFSNMQTLARLAESFLGSSSSSSSSSSSEAAVQPSVGFNAPRSAPDSGSMAMQGLKNVAQAFMGGGRSTDAAASNAQAGAQPAYSLPTIRDFIPGVGNNFGLSKGQGCLPFLSEAMQLMYGNCQKEADQKAFDAWGNELKNALLEGRMDLLRASKETCKRSVERQQCAALREAISNCDIMGSLQIGTQLQREVKRCDDVNGLIDQNPMAVVGQISQLMTGEVAQGFLSNFLRG